jgi:hypothetical protein
MICRPVANVLTNSALLRKYTKRLDLEWKKINIASSVKIVIKTIITIYTASFASRFISIASKMKMMISGLAVINAKGG